jgi:hypothetical protein
LQNFKAILTIKCGKYLEPILLLSEQGLKIEPYYTTSAITGGKESTAITIIQTTADGLYPSLQQFNYETFINDDTAG